MRRGGIEQAWWGALRALMAVAAVAASLAAGGSALAQPWGIGCNPNIRESNAACSPGASCLRVSGDCSPFAQFCLDNPLSDRGTADWGPLCTTLCSADSRGRCESGVAACRDDRDCVGRDACVNGACAFRVGSCYVNADCEAGRVCENFECRTRVAAACNANSQCGPDQACRGGQCAPREPVPACRVRADCAADEFCRDSKCITIPLRTEEASTAPTQPATTGQRWPAGPPPRQ